MSITLPEDFKNRMMTQLGGQYDSFIESYKKPPVRSFRLNICRSEGIDCARLSRILAGTDTPEEVAHCSFAYYYDEAAPGKTALHEAGACYIQEASAMLPVTMLDVSDSGQKILDLCAAPGGKSTQIADLMNGSGLLVSNEIIPSRALILSENIERMGVANALVISSDPQKLTGRFGGFFDRILVDAPCSGEGMFRKNPEAVSEWSIDNVKMCSERQDMLLDCAVSMLSEGGRIVYSTCTFAPLEDEETVERFLKRHPDFIVCEGPVKLYPHTFRGEGHFAVAFMRRSEIGNGIVSGFSPSSGGRRNAAKPLNALIDELSSTARETDRKRLLGEWLDNSGFSTAAGNCYDRILTFGDSIYLAPEYICDLSGLKVLRAGIKLGTFKKNRFEPDHALSHCLTKDDVDLYLDLPNDSGEIKQYLSGMTLNCDKDMKGWCLICVDGFGLGWAKAVGGILKNHYPKGLRQG